MVQKDLIYEKKPAGGSSWKDSDAPDGRFGDLGIKSLADWLKDRVEFIFEQNSELSFWAFYR